MSKHIENALLEAFPRFYYAAPVMEKHFVKHETGKALCSERGDAILWIVELLSYNEQGYCEQGDIEDILCRKYGTQPPDTTFRTRMRALQNAQLIELIDTNEATTDSRKNLVRLTTTGIEKLDSIKQLRLDFMAPVVSLLKAALPEERRVLLKYIRKMGESLWDDAKRDSSDRAKKMQTKSIRKRKLGKKRQIAKTV